MKTLELEKASPSLRKAARLARQGVVVITENGKPAFALVGVRDELALEALMLSRNASFMAYLDRISKRARSGRSYSLHALRRELLSLPRSRKRGGRRRSIRAGK